MAYHRLGAVVGLSEKNWLTGHGFVRMKKPQKPFFFKVGFLKVDLKKGSFFRNRFLKAGFFLETTFLNRPGSLETGFLKKPFFKSFFFITGFFKNPFF